MKIAFYLPRVYYNPGGGAKVVLEYANYLAKRGYEVSIYYHNPKPSVKYLPHAKYLFRILMDEFLGNKYGCKKWFNLDKSINEDIVSNADQINPCDIVVATAVQLVEPVLKLSKDYKHKVYLIQGYETWEVPEDKLFRIYNEIDNRVVISKWLLEKVDRNTLTPSIIIPNSIDENIFYNKKISRENHSIVFHYRAAPLKGCKYGIEVIKQLQSIYPDLHVKVISTEKHIPKLPSCCEVLKNISPQKVAQINNTCKVFLCTSIEEGFGLPGLEAMACGCALVTTNYQAVYDYAENEVNSLISPVMDTDSLVNNVCRLFDDDNLFKKISFNGEMTASKKNKKESCKLVEMYFRQLVGEDND